MGKAACHTCGLHEGKYRCPTCNLFNCSLACLQSHNRQQHNTKAANAAVDADTTAVVDPSTTETQPTLPSASDPISTINPPQAPAEDDDTEQFVLTSAHQKRLSSHAYIKRALQNKELQHIIQLIDSCQGDQNREELLEMYREKNDDFEEFVVNMLNIMRKTHAET